MADNNNDQMRIGLDGVQAKGSSTKILANAVATNLTIVVGTGALALGYCLYKADNPGELLTTLVEKVLGKAEATITGGGFGSLKFNIVAKTKQASDEILASYSSGEMLQNLNEVLLSHTKSKGLDNAEFDSIDLVTFEKLSISDEEFMALKKKSGEAIKNFAQNLDQGHQDKTPTIDDVDMPQSSDWHKPKLKDCIRPEYWNPKTASKELNKAVYSNGSQAYFLPVLILSFMHSLIDYKFGFSKKIIREISEIVKNYTSSSLTEVINTAEDTLYKEKNPGLSFMYYSISAKILNKEAGLLDQQRIEYISSILSGLKDAVLLLVKLDLDLKYVISEVMPMMNGLRSEISEISEHQMSRETIMVKKVAEVISQVWIAECYTGIGDNFGRKRVALKGIELVEKDWDQKGQCDTSLELVYVVLLNHYAEACDGPAEQESRAIYYRKAVDYCDEILKRNGDDQHIKNLRDSIENNFSL